MSLNAAIRSIEEALSSQLSALGYTTRLTCRLGRSRSSKPKTSADGRSNDRHMTADVQPTTADRRPPTLSHSYHAPRYNGCSPETRLACPYFVPREIVHDIAWPHPARLPLGAGWTGTCCAASHESTIGAVTPNIADSKIAEARISDPPAPGIAATLAVDSAIIRDCCNL